MGLRLRDVLGDVAEEAGAGAVLDVHLGAPGQQPLGDVGADDLVFLFEARVLVPLCVEVEAGRLAGGAVGVRVEVLAEVVALAFLVLPVALLVAQVALHDLDEVAPGLERGAERRVGVGVVARDGACDVLSLHVAGLEVGGRVVRSFDPDGHVDVEAAAVLVLLAVPALFDGADRGLLPSSEEVFLEGLPPMVVVASGVDRAGGEGLVVARVSQVLPPALVRGEGDEEGRYAPLHRHADQVHECFVPVRLAADDLLPDFVREGVVDVNVLGEGGVGGVERAFGLFALVRERRKVGDLCHGCVDQTRQLF